MSEYKGVKYELIKAGVWRIVWPSGLKVSIPAGDEDALKLKIDHALQLLN